MTKEKLNSIFIKELSSNEAYKRALGVVRKNRSGRIWLIGGFVFRTLAYKLYGCKSPRKDFDFIVEDIIKLLILPKGWQELETKFGNPKLKKDNLVIDLISLSNIHSIRARNMKPTIKNFLSGTPLTIQSIAFDVDNQRLIGKIGLRSLKDKTVGINNREEYKYVYRIYGDLYSVKRFANSLGFKEVR